MEESAIHICTMTWINNSSFFWLTFFLKKTNNFEQLFYYILKISPIPFPPRFMAISDIHGVSMQVAIYSHKKTQLWGILNTHNGISLGKDEE